MSPGPSHLLRQRVYLISQVCDAVGEQALEMEMLNTESAWLDLESRGNH